VTQAAEWNQWVWIMRFSKKQFSVLGGASKARSYQLIGAAILLALLHTDAAVAGCAAAPAGLVSWWRGENSTADAVGGNNGTIAGTGIVTYGPGVVGQAFVFDGTHRDRVELGNPANLQLQDFTLEAWVKRSSPTVTSFDVLGADGSVCGDGACIIGYGRGGYILAVANDGRLILSRTDIDGVISAPLLTDVNWHHLAVTKAGSTAVFYVDGLPQATPAYGPHEPYTFDDATCSCSAAIAIGSRGDARGGTFYGMIDEPAVFNRALSASEIQSIYAAGSAGICHEPPSILKQPSSQKVTLSRAADGTTWLRGSAVPGRLYIIETSTNLLNWEQIGVTTINGTAAFEFQDTNAPSSMRFYRVMSP
jgi:hypothetical protein